MSEQPQPSQSYARYQESTQFDNSADETQIDLHKNITVPRYNPKAVEMGRRAFDRPKDPSDAERLAEPIRIAARQLQNLAIARRLALDQDRNQEKAA